MSGEDRLSDREAGDVRRIFRNVEADSNVTLGAEVVDFVRLNGSQNAVERTGIVQVAVH